MLRVGITEITLVKNFAGAEIQTRDLPTHVILLQLESFIRVFQNWANTASFSFIFVISSKLVASRIQTRIVRVEGKDADADH